MPCGRKGAYLASTNVHVLEHGLPTVLGSARRVLHLTIHIVLRVRHSASVDLARHELDRDHVARCLVEQLDRHSDAHVARRRVRDEKLLRQRAKQGRSLDARNLPPGRKQQNLGLANACGSPRPKKTHDVAWRHHAGGPCRHTRGLVAKPQQACQLGRPFAHCPELSLVVSSCLDCLTAECALNCTTISC
jgi:hypothetical protein